MKSAAPHERLIPKLSLSRTTSFIPIEFDKEGRVVNVPSKLWQRSPSIIDELNNKGNIKACFDFSPFEHLKEIPGLKDEREITATDWTAGQFPTFLNKTDFRSYDNPDVFYTTLPTVMLQIWFKTKKGHFYGAIKTLETEPLLYLERSNGIIYINPDETLAGYNHTFYLFFKDKYSSPKKLLGKPISQFIHPTPQQLQQNLLRSITIPLPAHLSFVYGTPSLRSKRHQTINCSPPDALRLSQNALECNNKSDERHCFLSLRSPAR